MTILTSPWPLRIGDARQRMIRRPGAIVALLTGLNFLNYLDRMIVAAVLPRMQADLGFSNVEAGLLATVFLLGYFVTAPLFGSLADRRPRKGLIALGVLVWSAATIASGLASGLLMLFVARAMVGVGEASYGTLAPTIIDDITPVGKKGKVLAIFYLAVPVGSALGYLLGGYVQQHWGWRAAFFVGGGPGMVLALACLWIEEPRRTLATTKTRILDRVASLRRIPLFNRTVAGYCAHTAVLGAFSYWAPTFLFARYDMDLAKANFTFGVVTVAAGAVGTIGGGWWADRAQRGLPPVGADDGHDSLANRRAANALLGVCAFGVALAAPMSAAGFLSPGPTMFFVFVFFAEVGVFLSTSPVNALLLRVVPTVLRASSMAIAIFAIHMFGDLWSPPLLGLLADVLPSHLPAMGERLSSAPMMYAMLLLPVGLAISACLWWPRKHEADQ